MSESAYVNELPLESRVNLLVKKHAVLYMYPFARSTLVPMRFVFFHVLRLATINKY
ncbi:hypothetical protein NA56DRAFT_218838 [Hyaloscypha hepaticicola]|uniref:Uncharacterized protein n=1 Tax=Hyaloscypha hepaticicola TaxID=2082293 RepID=A0A2J6PXL3_9HELO|nr:hypothetical protein NA56DRAFT_218838 [Hyaloscypha hepaticicola]